MVFLRRYEESGGPFQRTDDDLAAMEKNASLLIAAAFTMIGFTLGRVTAPKPHGAHAMFKAIELDDMSGGPGEDIQVIIESFDDAEFEGDTVFAIPGGQVHLVRNGEEMEVAVEMTEAGENVWVEEGEANGAVVVKKQVIVTTEED